MDTKSNRFSRNTVTKFMAFILAVFLIAIAVTQVFYLMFKEFNIEAIFANDYKESSSFSSEVHESVNRTLWYFEEDDEEILRGSNHIFYISDGEKSSTNVEGYQKEDFEKYKESFFAWEDGILTLGENTDSNLIDWVGAEEDRTIYIAFTDEFLNEKQGEWEAERDELMPVVGSILTCIAVGLILIIYLMLVTGKKPGSEEIHSNWLDRIFPELLIIGLFLLVALWFLILEYVFWNPYTGYRYGDNISMNYYYLIGLITLVISIPFGIIVLALARQIKDGRFIKGFIVCRIGYRVVDFARSLIDGRRFKKYPLTKILHHRQLVFIGGSFLLVILAFFFLAFGYMFRWLLIIPPILEFVLIYWYVKYNNKTYTEINQGFSESLEEQMKAERMKLDLITNVSHDLKTPLTSIISYVDLLSKEEDLSESARDYVNILADKSERLKNIVSDLFDLAKSSSGNINLDLEILDMKKLIEQTLGDMEDNIEKSGQQIKTRLPETPVNIYSDGGKLYRVIQNVVDNALKYSLKGTRIFVELEERNGRAITTIKNTSNYEMDFSEEEILQRFSRGDKSRTTDGSGLGLSIAESFTTVSGGSFEIDIDGDLFKVIISFDVV